MASQLKKELRNYLKSQACRQSLRPFLEFLLGRHKAQGGVTELRIGPDLDWAEFVGLCRPKDADGLVEALAPLPDAEAGADQHPRVGQATICYNPHPVSKAHYARSKGTFIAGEEAPSTDLIAYSMFVVRIEPVRPGGAPPTDEERSLAIKVANEVARFFKRRGAFLISIDCGNWLEMLVPTVAYLNVDWAAARAQALADWLAREHATEDVKITGVALGDLCPLPGTVLVLDKPRKGRPHRLVKFLRPDKIREEVDLFALLAEEIAASRAKGDDQETPDDDVADEEESKDEDDEQEGPDEQEPDEENDEDSEDEEPEDQDHEDEAPAPRADTPRPAPVSSWDAPTAGRVLAGVLERSGIAVRVKDRDGECHYQFKDCPNADEEEGRAYGCSLVVRADGTIVPRCRHDEGAAWEPFKRLIGWPEHVRAVIRKLGIPPRSLPYRATDSGLVRLSRSGRGVKRDQLTNFTARIVADIEEDDGADTRRTLEVEATIDGRTIRFPVPAAQFRAMDWALDRLGARAILFPGARAHAAAAIQTLSGAVVTEKVYKHTGWTEIDGRFVYLHAGGGIGQDGPVPGVRVELPPPLALYRLPVPPSGPELRKAVRASLGLLDVAPDAVTVPLYGGIWRVLLGPTDSALQVTGRSGEGKTELVARVQQHWGPELDARHLPATWLSTANANETLAFLAKDAVLVVDDFVTAGGRSDGARQHREADRLLRGQGNSAGRGRLGSDATLQPSRPPRGQIFSTGEEIPRGQSLRARMFVLKLPTGAVDWERMTACQKDGDEGLYAAAFAGYVRGLAPRLEEVRRNLPNRWAALRDKATASGQHRRTPGIVADLFYGLELFSQFAVEAKAMSQKEANAFLERCWKALGEAAVAQAAVQSHGEPAQRFLKLLMAAVAAGQAHIAGPDGGAPAQPQGWGWGEDGGGWSAQGACVGWVDGPDLYLEPDAAFDAAQRVAQEGHEPLGVGSKSLHKRLHEQGHLVSTEAKRDRLLVRRTLQGQQRTVLHLRAEALIGTVSPPTPPSGEAGSTVVQSAEPQG